MEPDKCQPQSLISLTQKAFNIVKPIACDPQKKQICDNTSWRHMFNGTEDTARNEQLPYIFPLQHELFDSNQLHNVHYWKQEPMGNDHHPHHRLSWMAEGHQQKNGQTNEYAMQHQMGSLMLNRSDHIRVGNATAAPGDLSGQHALEQNGNCLYGTEAHKKPVRCDEAAETKRKLVALARDQESTEQRETRLELNRLRTNFSRMTESVEQRQARLETNRLYMRSVRQRETTPNREVRLLKTRVSQNISRLTESPEQRQVRLLKNRMRMNAHRQREPPDKRELRLQKNRERMSALRQQETPAQRFERQKQDQLRHASARQHESPDQRINRQNLDKIRHAYGRQQESPDQRLCRQSQDKLRHAIARQYETAAQKQDRQTLDKFRHALAREPDEHDGRHQRYTHEIQQIIARACTGEQSYNENAALPGAAPEWRMHSGQCSFTHGSGRSPLTATDNKDASDSEQPQPWDLHGHSALSYCDTQMSLPADGGGEARVKMEYQGGSGCATSNFISTDTFRNSTPMCFPPPGSTASTIQCQADCRTDLDDGKGIKTERGESDARC